MPSLRNLRRPLLLLPVLGLLAGCAAGPYSSDVTMGADVRHSSRIPFTYRVPEGWFDASTREDSTRNLIWLVRGDYGATMAVCEVVLDDEARRQLAGDGERVIAELSLGLAAGNPSTLVLTPLERVAVPQGEGYAFEQVNTETEDTTRVVVFRADGRAFEVQALVVGKGRQAGRESVFSAQRRFVEALRW
jgi:hypothetical protein